MIIILMFVVGLVAWALHLMQRAIESQEFSFMLAGFLVSTAAAGLMAVYFLMGHYVGYMTQDSDQMQVYEQTVQSADWIVQLDDYYGYDR